MDRRRATLWGILVCSTLFTIYTMWPRGIPARTATTGTAPSATTAPAPAVAAPPATTAAEPVPEAPPLGQAEFSGWRTQLGDVRRDPFFTVAELNAMNRPAEQAPAAPGAPTLPAYTVKLVLTAGSERHALVDGQVVKVGDILGSERVADIVPDAVVLERAGRRRRLEVAGASSTVQIQRERTR